MRELFAGLSDARGQIGQGGRWQLALLERRRGSYRVGVEVCERRRRNRDIRKRIVGQGTAGQCSIGSVVAMISG